MQGGLDGQPAEFSVYHDGAKKEIMPSKSTFYATVSDLVSIRTPGGGGYGDPLDRDPQAVLSDVVQGKVSRKRAREAYGVVIDPGKRRVDEGATLALRKRRRRETPSANG
jgi:N-methylhydantoinase B